MEENEKIDAYIKQMMAIKAKKENEQTKLDLEAISKELGVSEEELRAIEEERKKMVLLGQGFVEHQQADDAIAVLEKAYALNPDDAQTLSLLAQAYGMKFVQSHQPIHKQKSEEFASQALLQNPQDSKALELLQAVRYKPKTEVKWGKIAFVVTLVAGILLAASVVFFSREEKSNNSTNNIENVEKATNNQINDSKTIEYTNNLGEKVVFSIGSSDIEINFDGRKIKGKTKSAEKNKYKDESGKEIAEVKAKDAEAFKVRSPDGTKLLWKVKVDAIKVKVSDNEENKNPFELKKKEGKIKISRNEKEIIDLKGKDKHSEAAMYLTDIPKEQRYIIVAELLLRNM
ncbi:MAG: hypothetical protein NW226_00155 [Microscillaceae bacterium]|nr:hypothetical protein [Microscillaceae bacterium]